jgi:hypothetical protein
MLLRNRIDVNFVFTSITLCLLLIACRHVTPAPERWSTEAEIHAHITGEWTLKDESHVPRIFKLVLETDGSYSVFGADGTQAVGSWECEGRMLRLTRSTGDWNFYPVIYADEHELVITPGISVAGRLRFRK